MAATATPRLDMCQTPQQTAEVNSCHYQIIVWTPCTTWSVGNEMRAAAHERQSALLPLPTDRVLPSARPSFLGRSVGRASILVLFEKGGVERPEKRAKIMMEGGREGPLLLSCPLLIQSDPSIVPRQMPARTGGRLSDFPFNQS